MISQQIKLKIGRLMMIDVCIACAWVQRLINQIKGMELSSTSNYQLAKNKRRLIQQNTRLRQQIEQIESQISSLAVTAPIDEELPQNQHPQLLQEIAMQERLMKQLRARIQGFRLQRAKDNVEYIIHEEDELKIQKQVCGKLIEERDILARRKADKQERLQTNLPYQNYEKQFLEGLSEVVHHNREQAAQVTEIQREIRKYHLIVKNGKGNASQSAATFSAQDLIALQRQISDKIQQRKALERQWKPHLDQLDEEHAKLLRQLAAKKEVVAELQREERGWDTRMLTVRAPEDVLGDKKRVSQISINPKLKQQMQEYLLKQQQKKKKKVNNQQLKYQFKTSNEDQEKQAKNNKGEVPLPAALAKKKEEKVIETMHDDKNISKKVEKLNSKQSKKPKIDQMHNTDLSLPVKEGESASPKPKYINEQRSVRLWQANPEFGKKQSSKRQDSVKGAKNSILRLKQVSISTESRHWNTQQQ